MKVLQLSLRNLDMYDGAVDGVFGPKTQQGVLKFQASHSTLHVDGIVGTNTWGAIDQALDIREVSDNTVPPDPPPSHIEERWPEIPREIFEHLVESNKAIVAHHVSYGPGRGWYQEEDGGGHMVVTIGPYGIGGADYASRDEVKGPAFVCSTYTYFMLCLLLRVGPAFNQAIAGGVPSIFDVLTESHTIHPLRNSKWGYFGFRPFFRIAMSTGATATRRPSLGKQPKEMDLLEIWERRKTLPQIMFCSQAFASKGFHSHTAVIYIDRDDDHRVYRCAADGAKYGNVFSGTDMDIEVVDKASATKSSKSAWYRCYGMIPDELGPILEKPAARVTFEAAK